MVERTSQELQINTAQNVQAQQSGVGYASPDYAKYTATRDYAPIQGPGDSSSDRVVNAVLGVANKLAGQYWQKSTEEAYLDGVAKAGTIKSEDELQGSPLTRDWQKAGYRDTMGRLASADYEADIATDMHKMREKSPEEYADYLAQKRAKLMGSFEGMSLQARQSMFAQVMLNERTAIKKHGAEHYKFVVDQETKSIQSGFRVAVNTLNSSKDNGPVYEAATESAFNNLYTNVIRNSKLPDELRGKMVGEAAAYALESDNQLLYNKIKNTPITHNDGSTAPMMKLVSWEDEVKLSKVDRESMKRTEVFRAQKYMDDQAFMQADWHNPNTPLMPIEQVRGFADEGARRGFMSTDQYKSFMEDYYKASEKKAVQSSLAQAYGSGDQGAMWALKKTTDEGLEAWVNVIGSKMPLQQAVGSLLQLGNKTGQENAFKKVGQLMGPAFAQLGEGDTIDPTNAASAASVLQAVDQAEKNGRDGAMSQFMAGLDPAVQAKVMYMREGLRAGLRPDVAIQKANARLVDDSKLTPQMRQELSIANAKEDATMVADITERGIWGTGWMKAKSLVSKDASNTLALTTRRHWFENQDRVNEALATSRLALAEELSVLSKSNPYMSADSRRSAALANVAARTVQTDSGPIVVPRGMTVQGFFGVSSDVGSERVGKAIEEYIKPVSPDSRMAYSISNGKLMFQELNTQGKVVNSGFIDPKQVSGLVEEQRNKAADRFRLEHGEGTTRTDPTGSKVTFNGDNSAGVGNDWMFRLRHNLVDHEGVRDIPYQDLSGKMVNGKKVQTAGVGVTDQNPFYPKVGPDGKVSKDEIDRSFKLASNQAAQAAQRTMVMTRKSGEKFFQLFGELAYQSGPGFANLPAYKPMIEAIMKNDYEGAQKALEASPAWQWTAEGSKRRNHYRTTLKDAMRG